VVVEVAAVVAAEAEAELEAQEELAAEQAAAQPETPAAGPTQLNPLVDKAVRVEIPLPNLPAARARIVSIPQGQELGQEAPVPALAARGVRAARADSDNSQAMATVTSREPELR
jgi:hypothetical protein